MAEPLIAAGLSLLGMFAAIALVLGLLLALERLAPPRNREKRHDP